MEYKHSVEQRFLRWLKGFASCVDGVVIIVTLGFYDPGLAVKVLELCLKEMMKVASL